MWVKADNAKNLMCPVLSLAGYNSNEPYDMIVRCYGEKCMWWIEHFFEVSGEGLKPSGMGRCGLMIKEDK